MPPAIAPMHPTPVPQPFHHEGWVYEEKVDGYRVLAHKDGDRVRLISHHAKDLTARFPELAEAIRGLEGDRGRLQKMSRASGFLGRPEAAREIADVCVSLCSERLVREGRHLPAKRQ